MPGFLRFWDVAERVEVWYNRGNQSIGYSTKCRLLQNKHMKTIFDTLALPAFRERPGLYIGARDLQTLETWMQGYMSACEDADEPCRLETPNGLPIALLRDYIALRERDTSVGGIAYILTNAANGQNEVAWARFFTHLDDFMRLEIVEVQCLQVTDAMKLFAASQNRYFDWINGKEVPHNFKMNTLTKRILSNGLCWVTGETDHDERIFREPYRYSILPDKDADEAIMNLFGTAEWEAL